MNEWMTGFEHGRMLGRMDEGGWKGAKTEGCECRMDEWIDGGTEVCEDQWIPRYIGGCDDGWIYTQIYRGGLWLSGS